MNILDFQNRDERLSEVIARAMALGFLVSTDNRGHLVFEYSRHFIAPAEERKTRPDLDRLCRTPRTMAQAEHNFNLRQHHSSNGRRRA